MKKIKGTENMTLSSEELDKIRAAAEVKFKEFLEVFPFDIDNDQNLKETPKRVAKMFTDELFEGCFSAPPKITFFDDEEDFQTYSVEEPILVGPIEVKSICSHHFLPIRGRAYIGYVPKQKVPGLSKFVRIVNWVSKRPQIQERLTKQIIDYFVKSIDPNWVGVKIIASHHCMLHRGVEDKNAAMGSSHFYIDRDFSMKNPGIGLGFRQELQSYVTIEEQKISGS